MQPFFRPTTIAIIGASEREKSFGKLLFENLLQSQMALKAYPINLKHQKILGHHAYTQVSELPVVPELAMIAVPAKSVPKVVKACGVFGIRHAIIIASGFSETGTEAGRKLEEKINTYAQRYQMKILGPSSIGIISPQSGLNASIVHNKALKGNIAFVSQSGSLCESILDWGKRENLGFSHFISTGSMAGIGWGELLLFLADDPHTKAILLYIESISDARAFISATREAAFTKPIIAMKAGRTKPGTHALYQLTGLSAGNDKVYDAAFRRSGILRVNTLGELFFMASTISKQQGAKGNRLAIVSNASGPAILALDALVEHGGRPSHTSPELETKLRQLPHLKKRQVLNPLDIGAYPAVEDFEQIIKTVLLDTGNDGVLVILSPQSENTTEQEAEKMIALNKLTQKPIVACIMGGEWAESAIKILNKAGVPSVPYPDTAAKVFNFLWKYGYNIKGIYETPKIPKLRARVALKTKVDVPLDSERKKGRTMLSEFETKLILRDYGLPVVETRLAYNETEAVEQAQEIGFPVVLKVHSRKIVQKARVGGVMLNLQVRKSIKKAFGQIKENISHRFGKDAFLGVTVQRMYNNPGLEMIIGSYYDPQFGPVIKFGNGGRIVEVYQDNALALPPLNTTLAHRLLEQTHIYQILLNGDDKEQFLPVVAELEQLLVQFSHLVVNHPQIKSIDLNPVAVSTKGIQVLDANIQLHEAATSLEKITPLAIRPYPVRYESEWKMKDGQEVLIRPIKPEDEPLVIQFHKTLSDESVYMRYFHPMSYHSRTQHDRLARICFVDYAREMPLVAIKETPSEGDILLGVGRILKMRNSNTAEFSMTISDSEHGKGLGSEFMRRLIGICQEEGIEKLVADILPNNSGMRQVCERFGFSFKMDFDEQVLKASLPIK